MWWNVKNLSLEGFLKLLAFKLYSIFAKKWLFVNFHMKINFNTLKKCHFEILFHNSIRFKVMYCKVLYKPFTFKCDFLAIFFFGSSPNKILLEVMGQALQGCRR